MLYFPGCDIRVLLGIIIPLGWVSAFVVIMIWSTERKKQEDEKALKKKEQERKKLGYPGGPANHFIGVTADGGWLYMYPDSLVFKPEEERKAKNEVSIKYSEIAEVKPGAVNTLWISSKKGNTETFAVYENKLWVKRIRKKLSEAG
ncbi:MAG: hypothetical protein K6F99_06970 [Lachnospiraceae bacterium]|nr:hypothetical protein [Lachnospiraceae bacterium]